MIKLWYELFERFMHDTFNPTKYFIKLCQKCIWKVECYDTYIVKNESINFFVTYGNLLLENKWTKLIRIKDGHTLIFKNVFKFYKEQKTSYEINVCNT